MLSVFLLHENDDMDLCSFRQRSLRAVLNGTSTSGWEKKQARLVYCNSIIYSRSATLNVIGSNW